MDLLSHMQLLAHARARAYVTLTGARFVRCPHVEPRNKTGVETREEMSISGVIVVVKTSHHDATSTRGGNNKEPNIAKNSFIQIKS